MPEKAVSDPESVVCLPAASQMRGIYPRFVEIRTTGSVQMHILGARVCITQIGLVSCPLITELAARRPEACFRFLVGGPVGGGRLVSFLSDGAFRAGRHAASARA